MTKVVIDDSVEIAYSSYVRYRKHRYYKVFLQSP
jgi:hypothetical protein